MKEIGGYFELNEYNLPMLHDNLLKFNSGRNCLAYLIETKKIKKIYLPYYICDSVIDTCKKYNLDIDYYDLNNDFMPINLEKTENSYLYVVNYFGQLNNYDKKYLLKKYNKIIIDNTQAYFDKPFKTCDNIYTCRKYFGVPDGALLYTDMIDNYQNLDTEISYDKMKHILGRYEISASKFYNDYSSNEDDYSNKKILKMSKISNNLLHGIDYKMVKKIRNRNYNFLLKKLKFINKLSLRKVNGAYAYPLYLDDATELRKELIENKIYVPTLWPNVLEDKYNTTKSYDFAKNIIPIPCDQRYTISDMERICNIIYPYFYKEVKK